MSASRTRESDPAAGDAVPPGGGVSRPGSEPTDRGSSAAAAWAVVTDRMLRVVGGVFGVWAAVLAATVESFLVPLRVAGHRVPAAILLAVVANVVLAWYMREATGSRLATLLPGLVWFVVTVPMGSRTDEGDLILTGDNWVSLSLLLVGAGSVALGVFLAIGRRPRAERPLPSTLGR